MPSDLIDAWRLVDVPMQAEHRLVDADRRRDCGAAGAMHLSSRPGRFRAHVDRMYTWKQGPGLYRTCVPGPNDRRSFCVFVNTRHEPPLAQALGSMLGVRQQCGSCVRAVESLGIVHDTISVKNKHRHHHAPIAIV